MFTAATYVVHSLLMLFLLSQHGSLCQVYHITPSENTNQCSESYNHKCMSLTQFAADSSRILESNSNVSLILLSGNHTLNRSFAVQDYSGNFLMYSNTNAVITCDGDSQFSFINVTGSVQIADLEFIGCGGNRMKYVKEFFINTSNFQGLIDTSTALHFVESNVQIIECSFASYMVGTYRQSIRTLETLNNRPDFSHTFGSNGGWIGGAIIATHSNVSIIHSLFCNNSAQAGGAIFVEINSVINVINSSFINNALPLNNSIGGAVHVEDSTFRVHGGSLFLNNQAFAGGAVGLFQSGGTIDDGKFTNNLAFAGAAVYCYNGNAAINGGKFGKNVAIITGGVVYSLLSTISIDGGFYDNHALRGAVLYVEECLVYFQGATNLNVSGNSAQAYATIYLAESTGYFVGNITVSNNDGTVVIFNSNVTFAANITFANNSHVRASSGNLEEGGAITAFQSTVSFHGVSKFVHNSARNGGAMHVTESTLYVNDQVIITYNTAENGGGIFLYQSDIRCQPKSALIVSDNEANERGGGIHAISSTIQATTRSFTTEGAHLEVSWNKAKRGGGLYLEANARVYVFKRDPFQDVNFTVSFISNNASYGGAVYVEDNTNFGTCIVDSTAECFFQIIALHQFPVFFTLPSISFSQNFAATAGSPLFGGLLDRCTVSPFAEIHNIFDRSYQNGIDYINDASDLGDLSSVSSDPVRLCLCIDDRPQCSYRQPNPLMVRKGETFTLSLVAVDQVGQNVDAVIQSSLKFTESGLAEGQLMQSVTRQCTNLNYSIASPHSFERLTLYASDGPCRDAGLSSISFPVEFVNCSCPIGFQVSTITTTSCMCKCPEELSEVICDIETELLTKSPSSTTWFSYISSTLVSGYIVYPNCPYDYCKSGNVSVNLNLPNGADAQCAFHRSGLLCGSCQQNFSLSLGGSLCLSCPNYWPALLVSVTIVGILAGLALVIVVLVLNMSVSVGTLNGLIFYANIVAAYGSILLPPGQNFATVVISWLNLDIGIDLCYFPGMDAFSKTCLQLAFPLYILFLVVMIMVISSHSTRFSNLLGKRNPVATLATLLLLSYTKFLTFILNSMTFGTLEYPDGSLLMVWLPDASVKFLSGKHIALFITAVILLLAGLIYTTLIFSWQWLLHLPQWKIFKFVRHQKLHGFVECYNAPYTPRHRYWTGLLLLMRIILVLSAQINSTNDPRYALSSVVFVIGFLLSLKGAIGIRVYKAWPLDVLEMLFYFNILFLATLTFASDHPAVAYTSVGITLILLLFIITFHVYVYSSLFSKVRESSFGIKLNTLFETKVKSELKSKDDVYGSHEILDIIDRPKEPTCSIVTLPEIGLSSPRTEESAISSTPY